jgi:hypothetical protein
MRGATQEFTRHRRGKTSWLFKHKNTSWRCHKAITRTSAPWVSNGSGYLALFDYLGVDDDIVSDVVTTEVPTLRHEIESIIQREKKS